MFKLEDVTQSTLLCGPYDLTKSFTFEAAMHWALEGRHVLYVTPTPLTAIPAKYHDREGIVAESFKMIKFMYLDNYEDLIEFLVDLHTHRVRPAVLLIDKLDTYIDDPQIIDEMSNHIAKLCAILHDTMHACATVSKVKKSHILASITPQNFEKCPIHLFFHNIWKLEAENEASFSLSHLKNSSEALEVFKYKKFDDETLILHKIIERLENT